MTHARTPMRRVPEIQGYDGMAQRKRLDLAVSATPVAAPPMDEDECRRSAPVDLIMDRNSIGRDGHLITPHPLILLFRRWPGRIISRPAYRQKPVTHAKLSMTPFCFGFPGAITGAGSRRRKYAQLADAPRWQRGEG